MATDYLPKSEAELLPWLANFNEQLTTYGPTVGILAAETATLATQTEDWVTSFHNNETAQAAAQLARSTKDNLKKELLTKIRAVVTRVQSNPGTSDPIRNALGITIRDGVRTTDFSAAVAVARPIGKVDTSNRLQHIIDFRDSANENKRAKPEGVRGCELWIKVGEVPAGLAGGEDPADMRFLALDTATPYVMHFNQVDAGKTAHYVLRWVANDGTKGPWSETVDATIVG